MKRLSLGAGLVLLIACLWVSPAEAFCYECKYSGLVCYDAWCTTIYTCRLTNSICNECWENCYESLDEGCWVSHYCQFASFTPKDDLPSFIGPTAPWAAVAP